MKHKERNKFTVAGNNKYEKTQRFRENVKAFFSAPITFTIKILIEIAEKTINWIFNICVMLKKFYFKIRRSKEIKANQGLTKSRKSPMQFAVVLHPKIPS